VVHVEAGLRSGERYSPYPEEINRRMVDQLSHLLCAPTEPARQILLHEGFDPASVFCTGNTVVDALLWAREIVRRDPPPLPDRVTTLGRMILVTAHRRESFGATLEGMCRAMLRIVDAAPDVGIVYPVHLNPNVAGPVRRLLGENPRIVLLEPVSYLPFVALMDRAHLVLTDSGGVQEEAPTFGKPLLVMRDVTERPEGIRAGVARLVGTTEQRIFDEAMRLLSSPSAYAAMAGGQNPYGDGTAACRIADLLEQVPTTSALTLLEPRDPARETFAAAQTAP
jgi:UDP-N-acetylglucosamine 2-epimerase (non-hydrolysing)